MQMLNNISDNINFKYLACHNRGADMINTGIRYLILLFQECKSISFLSIFLPFLGNVVNDNERCTEKRT